MKILYLSHRIPYPPNKGDKIRSFNEVKYLSKHHQVDIACLADAPGDLKFKNNLAEYGRNVHVEPLNTMHAKIRGILTLLSGGSISVGYFHSTKLQKVIDQWLLKNIYDAIICFSSPMAEYLLRSGALNLPRGSRATHPSVVMDFCDVDSDKWRQYGKNSRFPLNRLYQAEFHRLLAYEKKINSLFDHSLFVSQKEAALFRALAPEAQNISVIPNGVDSDYFSPEAASVGNGTMSPESQRRAQKLMFSGAMNYQANIDGVTWFSREIFPHLLKHHSNLNFVIVGSNPAACVRALANGENIRVTGFVEDIRPYYAAADICVIPLRMARGVQNKVLEAMAMGKAVVSTSAALQGISATNGEHLLVADTAEDFIRILKNLSSNPDLRLELGTAARKFATRHYSWNTHMQQLDELITAKKKDSRRSNFHSYWHRSKYRPLGKRL